MKTNPLLMGFFLIIITIQQHRIIY